MDMRAPTHDGPTYNAANVENMDKEAPESGAIPQALASLEKRIEMLCKATQRLEEVLNPVLIPADKVDKPNQNQTGATIEMPPVAVRIDDLSGLLHLRIEAIMELHDRVDL